MLSRWSSAPCLEWILLIFLFSLKCSSGGEKVIQKKLNLLSTIFVCNYGFQWRGNIFIIYMLILSCRDHFRRSRKWAEFSLSYFATLHKCVLTFFLEWKYRGLPISYRNLKSKWFWGCHMLFSRHKWQKNIYFPSMNQNSNLYSVWVYF